MDFELKKLPKMHLFVFMLIFLIFAKIEMPNGKKLDFNLIDLHDLGQFFSDGHILWASEKNCPSSCRPLKLKCNFFP